MTNKQYQITRIRDRFIESLRHTVDVQIDDECADVYDNVFIGISVIPPEFFPAVFGELSSINDSSIWIGFGPVSEE